MPPPHNSRLAAFVAFVAGFAATLAVLVPLVGQLLQPLVRNGQLPSGVSPAAALFVPLFSVAVVLLLASTLYRRVNTRLTDQGVVVPGLKGPRVFPWSEFTRVSGKGVQVRLHTSGPTVTLNVLCYSPPSAVVPFLAGKLSSQLFAPHRAA